MLSINTSKKYKDLLNEISDTLHHWPELDRRVFILAHYRGQSSESIAHNFKLDAGEINKILNHCDRELYVALREFRGCDGSNIDSFQSRLTA